jgi:hypothetical protein
MSILSLAKGSLRVVLGFLNIKELGRMALVNHSIRDVEEDDRVWNAIHDTLLHNINNGSDPQLGTASLFDEDLEIAHLTQKIFVRILVSDHFLCSSRYKNWKYGRLNFIRKTIIITSDCEYDAAKLAMKHPYMPKDSFTVFSKLGPCLCRGAIVKDHKGSIRTGYVKTQFNYPHYDEYNERNLEYIRQNFSRLTYFHIECRSEEYAAKAARILDDLFPTKAG